MTKFALILLAGVTLAAPALADNGYAYSFERDGTRYRVTESVRAGVRYIDGVDANDRAFHLRVKNGWVDGDFAGSRVSYAVPKTVRFEQTASR